MQVSDQEQVWTAVAQQLRDQLTEAVWFSTFEGVRPLERPVEAAVRHDPRRESGGLRPDRRVRHRR